MPRPYRADTSGICFHIITRGNDRRTVFHDADDFSCFIYLMRQAIDHVPIDLYGYCLMPNHVHLVLRTRRDGDMGKWMHWLLTTHAHRHHFRHGRCGHVWQGRYKSFPVEESTYFYTLLRYVERNPVTASLARSAMDWPWSSVTMRDFVAPWPLDRPADWLRWVDTPNTQKELDALRQSVSRGAPFGSEAWSEATAQQLGIQGSRRPLGRPKKVSGPFLQKGA